MDKVRLIMLVIGLIGWALAITDAWLIIQEGTGLWYYVYGANFIH